MRPARDDNDSRLVSGLSVPFSQVGQEQLRQVEGGEVVHLAKKTLVDCPTQTSTILANSASCVVLVRCDDLKKQSQIVHGAGFGAVSFCGCFLVVESMFHGSTCRRDYR